MDWLVDVFRSRWMDGWIEGWVGGWIRGWVYGWLDGGVEGWVDEERNPSMDAEQRSDSGDEVGA